MTRAILAILLLFAFAAAYAQSTDKLEFEAASIKPAPPPEGGRRMVRCDGGPGTKDPTTFTCQNMTLSNLIGRAYQIAYYQLSAPDWMTGIGNMFNVSAKVAPGTTKEQFDIMLQNLLVDRFKLAVHRESRDLQKFELVVAKNGPKFKEAAPPPPAKEDAGGDAPRLPAPGPPKLDQDGFPNLGGRPGMAMMNGRARMYQPQMTMQMLAGQLSAQMGKPVTDATGLTGKYEITLYWSAEMRGAPPPPPPGGGAIPMPSETDSGPTLLQAIQDQLGLRLESKKGPVEFLVVDHAEKVPTEN